MDLLNEHRGVRVYSGSFGFGARLRLGFDGFTWAVLGVGGFIRVRMGSLGRSPDSFGFPSVLSGVHRGRRDHSGSPGFNRASLGVAGFVRVRKGSLWRA